MTVELVKVVYQVHMLRRDNDGHVVDEVSTEQPLVTYARDVGALPETVAEVVRQVTAQLEQADTD